MTAVNPTGQRELQELMSRPPTEQAAAGYAHTLREILQQPATWERTAAQLRRALEQGSLASALAHPRPSSLILTGSGSSHYIGECLAFGLQRALDLPVQAVPAGTLLTHWPSVVRPGALVVSFARSGDSPESAAVVDALLEGADCRHLFLTCNSAGHLATHYRDEERAAVLVLDELTNDRSLVMTSSFSNLVLAGRALAAQDDPAGYAARARLLAKLGAQIFEGSSDDLAQLARHAFSNVVFLGSGGRYGAAREGALKMLEMSAGRVQVFAETYLGLRHGPMSALDSKSFVVAFLSGDPVIRSYEVDLLRELSRKHLGGRRLLVGEGIPDELVGLNDLAIELPGLADLDDEEAPLLHVVVAQLLGFFRCLHLGLQPDAPAQGVLTRVVERFAIHGNGNGNGHGK